MPLMETLINYEAIWSHHFAFHLKTGERGNSNRVLRGGSWNNNTNNLRCANRNRNNANNTNNNNGFRCSQYIPGCRKWVTIFQPNAGVDAPGILLSIALSVRLGCPGLCSCAGFWTKSAEYKTTQRRLVSLRAEHRSWDIFCFWDAISNHRSQDYGWRHFQY